MAKKQNPETVEQTETVETQQPQIGILSTYLNALRKQDFIIESLNGVMVAAYQKTEVREIRVTNNETLTIKLSNGYTFEIKKSDIAFVC